MEAFWGRQGSYFILSLLEYQKCHQQSQGIVPCRFHQQTAAGTAAPRALKSATTSTKNTRRNKQCPGLAGSAEKPLFPCHDTGWWQSPPQHLLPATTAEKAEGHVPQQFRYLSWKENRMAHKLLGRHPKQNKKPKPFCAAPPPTSCRPPSWALAACSALDVSTTLGSNFSTIKDLDPGEGLTLMGSQHRSSKAFLQIYAFFEHKSGDPPPLLRRECYRSTPEGWRCSSSPQH